MSSRWIAKERKCWRLWGLSPQLSGVIMLLVILFVSVNLSAGVKLTQYPVWQELYISWPTGIGWADFDGNGWNDLVLSNGLDIIGSPNLIYFNSEAGLETTPGWTSDDVGPSGLHYIGDLDNDGNPDLIVPWLGYTPSFNPGPHAVYFNQDGLSTTPDWTNSSAHGFSCTVGDPDGDGDLDIAFAQGSYAAGDRRKAVIYFNEGGSFGETPGWESDLEYFGVDIAFADMELDGDLDLILSGRTIGLKVFYNDNGVIETSPSWQIGTINGGRQIAVGDIDGDEYPDLAVANVGYGFYIFKNQAGTFESFPSWTCNLYAEPSCVALADADGDGDLDLAAGSWYGPSGVFENIGGTFTSDFVWSYPVTGSGQQVAWGEYDNDMLTETSETFVGDGSRKLFYLDKMPFDKILSVEADGTPLPLSQYCYDPMAGWVSLANPPGSGIDLTIIYRYSNDLELAATSANGVYVFENRSTAAPGELKILLLQDQQQGANYDIVNSSFNIIEQFDQFGWIRTTAGLTETISRCGYSQGIGLRPLRTDLLISEIADVTDYNIVCLLPAATGLPNLLSDPVTLELLNTAADAGVVVAAWCRAVRVLAAADLIDGLNVVGHADYETEYEAAGATYFGDNHPPIIQDNIVTSVRSNYYRTAMCQAMARALPPKIISTSYLPQVPTQLDSLIITSFISDFAPIDTAAAVVDTGTGFFAIDLFDDGNHHDGLAGDSLYGGVLPPISEGKEVSYYIKAVEDTIHTTVYDPADAPATTHNVIISYAMPGVIISEFMASDNDCCPDDMGDYDDWVELYNSEEIPVNISGAYLTNDLGITTKFEVGDITLPAHGYAVFWLDNEVSEGEMHANFILSETGGEIGLFDADRHGNLAMSTLSYSQQPAGYSNGQLSDISGTWVLFHTPTPGVTNGEYICGDVNYEYSVNILDIVYLINYLYKSGPVPNPTISGDVNHDTMINILDIVYLINYIYKNGPTPACL